VADELADRIGSRIRELRNEAGLSQEKLADRCGVHRTYIGAIERGEKNITAKTAEKVGSALDVSIEELFSNLPDEPDN
jgi:transcriptional regulator with XRE-family HTH domain